METGVMSQAEKLSKARRISFSKFVEDAVWEKLAREEEISITQEQSASYGSQKQKQSTKPRPRKPKE